MKRTITFLIAAVLVLGLLGLPLRVQAAPASVSAGRVTTASGRLNVRQSPSSSARVAATLGKGSYVTLISRSGQWWYVEYARGSYGYCHADYITPVSSSAAEVKTQSGSLNVRSGPGTGYARVGSLFRGEDVLVLSTDRDWSRVLYHGSKTGYVSSRYISAGFPAVSLEVPNYKQTDSRWADLTIGTSGKTMAQIGCATTAIAMMESFHRKTAIYPDAMAGELRYTPSGSVYWPSDYVTVTDTAGYLERIYALLRQGKPVLFGAQNAYGKQHWVVVTGFTGGHSLTAAGFTIHDPGTWSRTNLGQFLEVYPQIYKYFYHS